MRCGPVNLHDRVRRPSGVEDLLRALAPQVLGTLTRRLEMAGETGAAIEHYRRAARLTTNLPEQRYLAKRAALLAMRTAD